VLEDGLLFGARLRRTERRKTNRLVDQEEVIFSQSLPADRTLRLHLYQVDFTFLADKVRTDSDHHLVSIFKTNNTLEILIRGDLLKDFFVVLLIGLREEGI
jgi:hypothetical protein